MESMKTVGSKIILELNPKEMEEIRRKIEALVPFLGKKAQEFVAQMRPIPRSIHETWNYTVWGITAGSWTFLAWKVGDEYNVKLIPLSI